MQPAIQSVNIVVESCSPDATRCAGTWMGDSHLS